MTTISKLGLLLRYSVDGNMPVAQGGCGHIWRARDLLFDRDVAIKTVSERLLWDAGSKASRTLKREAMAAARLGELSHHIVKVHDMGLAQDVMYYVMEWIEPEAGFRTIDLGERAGMMTLAKAKAALMQVCDAVAVAHQQGIVHSDIAPHNVIFDSARQVFKITDFGLLKVVEEYLVSRGSGSILQGGRLDFMPPEVRGGSSGVSYASDVYALAVTLRVLVEGFGCLPSGGGTLGTPGVVRLRYEQRDAPDQLRQMLSRFIDGHTPADSVDGFVDMLQRVPN